MPGDPSSVLAALGLDRRTEQLYFRLAPVSGHTVAGVAQLVQQRPDQLMRSLAPLLERGLVVVVRRPGRGPGAGRRGVRARAAPGAVGGVVGGHAGRALERGAAPRGLDDAPRPAPRHRGPPPRRRAELGRQPVGAPAADAAHQPRRHAVAAPRRLGDAARVAGQRAGRRGDGDGSTLPGDLPRPGADRGARRAARACRAGGAGADHLRGAHPDVHLRRHPRGDPRADRLHRRAAGARAPALDRRGADDVVRVAVGPGRADARARGRRGAARTDGSSCSSS